MYNKLFHWVIARCWQPRWLMLLLPSIKIMATEVELLQVAPVCFHEIAATGIADAVTSSIKRYLPRLRTILCCWLILLFSTVFISLMNCGMVYPEIFLFMSFLTTSYLDDNKKVESLPCWFFWSSSEPLSSGASLFHFPLPNCKR